MCLINNLKKFSMKKINLFSILVVALMFVGFSFSSCSKDDNSGGSNNGKTDPSTIATANLIAYWGFENSPKDAIGQRGTASSDTIYATGRRGKAFKGGTKSYISFDVPATDKLATMTEFTVAMWLKAPSLTATSGVPCFFQLSKGDTWNGAFTMFQDNLGDNLSDSIRYKMYFQKVGVPWAGQWIDKANPNFLADKWFHLVVNYSAATSIATLYVNGGAFKLQTLSAYDSPVRFADDPGSVDNVNGAAKLGALNLGLTGGGKGSIGYWANKIFSGFQDQQDWTGFYYGMIDELRVYNKALSDQEVKSLYDAEVTQIN